MVLVYGYVAEDVVREKRANRDDIRTIREWNLTADVPILTDEQIVGFLISCDGDVEFAKKTVLSYFRIRAYAKELFNDRDMEKADMQLQLATLEYIEFPVRTADNCVVIYHKLHDTTYWKYNMECSMKLLFMTVDAALYKYPPNGLIFLFDMKGVSLMHLTRIKLSNLKAFFDYCQEGSPGKLKAVHVLNSVSFLDKILAILKPFIKKELYEMIHFHQPNMDMERFYEKYLEKACLPSDYGGDLPNTRILHGENTRNLTEMRAFFDEEELIRANFTNKK